MSPPGFRIGQGEYDNLCGESPSQYTFISRLWLYSRYVSIFDVLCPPSQIIEGVSEVVCVRVAKTVFGAIVGVVSLRTERSGPENDRPR